MKNVKSKIEDKILNILNTIDSYGYESFLVGGFVRDLLLNKKSFDIDICTNANTSFLMNLFKVSNSNYGSIRFKLDEYDIDITTFRKELEYEKRKPINYINVDTLDEDLLRRDFTINAICIDKDGNILDKYNGLNDLNNKLIRAIGDVNKKLQEDPLRILRAIRFSSILDFNIENDLSLSIKDNYILVKNLSDYRIKEELSKILLNSNFKKGLSLLKDYNILDILNISYNDNINFKNDVYEMWAQLNFEHNYGFTKSELNNIINIRQKNK